MDSVSFRGLHTGCQPGISNLIEAFAVVTTDGMFNLIEAFTVVATQL
ncbi:MAG TPA: hypothetical protein VE954_01135 [Oligoflexus sp.]|nr:hypothetical protein [Oligoflexus sp.]HYX31685.1 hypothetical protein [Oligoflexus sp.]